MKPLALLVAASCALSSSVGAQALQRGVLRQGGFLQGGTGAQIRSGEDKLRDVVSVKDFGAKGDGSTDDTAAIQAALTAASTMATNTAVLFPAPAVAYLTTSALIVPSNVAVYTSGPGDNLKPTISYTGSGWAFDESDKASVTIHGITVKLGSSGLGCFRLRANASTSESRHRLTDTGCVAAGSLVSGQVGYLFQTDTNTATLYHNVVTNPSTVTIDIGYKFVSLVAAQGPNGNQLIGPRCNGHTRCIQMLDGTDNIVSMPSILGAAANPIAIQLGGTGSGGYCTLGNVFTSISSEQGASGSTTVSIASASTPVVCTLSNQSNLFSGWPNDITQISDSSAGGNQFLFSTQVTLPKLSLNVPTGTAPLTVASKTPVANLSLSGGTGTAVTTDTLQVGASLSSSGVGMKHSRAIASGCTTSATAGATCDVTVNWGGTAFPNTNYTAVCSGDNITSGIPLNGGVVSKAAGSLVFRTVAATASAAGYITIDCHADHD